ncbi:MAG: glycosyltransferase [Marmoricola sp.]
MADRWYDEIPAASPSGEWPVLVPEVTHHVACVGLPTLSVVVAAHQAGGTVAEALDSALEQSYPALEVVVCDDGSTDGTAEVLASYADRVTVIRRPNRGEGAAKNAAVRAAAGDYVVVLDADDVFHPRRLEALAWLAAERADLDVLTTDAVVEAHGVPVRRAYHSGWTFPTTDQRSAILDRNFVFGLAAVRRERWLSAGGFDEGLARTADWDFWIRLVLGGSRVGLVDAPLARYRLTSGTLSSDRRRLVAARVEVLARVALRDDLDEGERATLARSLRTQRADLAVRDAAAALEVGGWAARRTGAALLTEPGVGLRARLGAAAILVSPAVMARRRARREAGTVEIGSGIRVPTEP